MQLIQALALHLQVTCVSPLTTLHIKGTQNSMIDIPLCSFEGAPKSFCVNDTDFLTLYNKLFPLPSQQSWNLFRLSSGTSTKIISILQMKDIDVEVWHCLQKSSRLTGPIGKSLSNLWAWTLTYMGLTTPLRPDSSRALLQESAQESLEEAAMSQLKQTVSLTLTAIGQMIALAVGKKIMGSNKLFPDSPKC